MDEIQCYLFIVLMYLMKISICTTEASAVCFHSQEHPLVTCCITVYLWSVSCPVPLS